jgi:hypothetical protein
MSRNVKRIAAILALAGMLGIGFTRPTPAMAVDTEEGLLLAGVALAGYLTLVFVSTAIIYGHDLRPLPTTPVDWPRRDALSKSGLRLADRCPQGSGGVTFACW